MNDPRERDRTPEELEAEWDRLIRQVYADSRRLETLEAAERERDELRKQLAEAEATMMGTTISDTLEAIVKNDKNYDVRYGLVIRAMCLAQSYGLKTGIRFDPQEPQWPVVFIELPTGQVSWHMPEHEKEWDGHDNERKFGRIGDFVALLKSQSEYWSEARRLPSPPLPCKRHVETLNAIIAKKDEALERIKRDLRRGAHPGNITETVNAALSLTPASAKEVASDVPVLELRGILPPDFRTHSEVCEEFERIGRAVVEWANAARPPTGFSEPGAAGYAVAICDMLSLIAEVRG